jgi:cytochrome c-type biogenesis protein CcmH/NrfG
MLLDAGKATEALAAFESTMKKEPNRFRGLYGGARAAEMAGDKVKAAAYYKQLVELAAEADTERAEIKRAKEFLGARSSAR